MTTVKEIAIVGGGLAGLSLGIALRSRGVPARIYEAGSYPRHKVCGEFIAGLSDETIATLGIAEALQGAWLHREVAWLQGGQVFRRDRLPRPAYGISRHRLDERLANQFRQLGGALETGVRVHPGRQDVVWTAGRQRRRSEWMGVKLHCRALTLASDLEVHLGEGAYAGASAVEDGRVNVCALVKRPSAAAGPRESAFFQILADAGLADLAARARAGDPDLASFSSVAGLGFGRSRRDENRIELGDAYALPPPFTGDGMAMAFEGAAVAVEPIACYARGELSWSEASLEARRRLRRQFRTRLAVGRGVHRFLHDPFARGIFRVGTSLGALPFKPLFNLLH